MRIVFHIAFCLALLPACAAAVAPLRAEAGSAMRTDAAVAAQDCQEDLGRMQEKGLSERIGAAGSRNRRHPRNGLILPSRIAAMATTGRFSPFAGCVSARLQRPTRPSDRPRMSVGFTEFNRPR